MSSTIRLIQITDCHLMEDPKAELKGVCTRERFDRVIQAIRLYATSADRLIITGDLTHDEKLVTYQSLRDQLGDWGDRIRVIPGNHDDRLVMRNVFGDFVRVEAERNVFVESFLDWQLIGLDTHLPGQVKGEIGALQLNWLIDVLSAARSRSTCLFMHHPPVNVGSKWLDEVGLVDREPFLEQIARFPNVRAIWCGHIHQERTILTPQGIPVFSTPSTGVQFRPEVNVLEVDTADPGFRVIEMSSDGLVSTRVERVG